MNQKLLQLSQRYVTALRKFLKGGVRASLQPAVNLGCLAVALELKALDLVQIHEQAVATLELSTIPNGSMRRAKIFFTESVAPIVDRQRSARQSKMELNRLNQTLKRRTTELAANNRQLQRGIVRRKSLEVALRKCSERYAALLKQSVQLQEGLRQLAHQVLAAQEDERRIFSHKLQDEIAQDLLGINVRLLSLKQEATCGPKDLANQIANVQRLVTESARSVRRVTRNFGKA